MADMPDGLRDALLAALNRVVDTDGEPDLPPLASADGATAEERDVAETTKVILDLDPSYGVCHAEGDTFEVTSYIRMLGASAIHDCMNGTEGEMLRQYVYSWMAKNGIDIIDHNTDPDGAKAQGREMGRKAMRRVFLYAAEQLRVDKAVNDVRKEAREGAEQMQEELLDRLEQAAKDGRLSLKGLMRFLQGGGADLFDRSSGPDERPGTYL